MLGPFRILYNLVTTFQNVVEIQADLNPCISLERGIKIILQTSLKEPLKGPLKDFKEPSKESAR